MKPLSSSSCAEVEPTPTEPSKPRRLVAWGWELCHRRQCLSWCSDRSFQDVASVSREGHPLDVADLRGSQAAAGRHCREPSWLFLGLSSVAPDEPRTDADHEHEPPQVAQFASRHLGEGRGVGEDPDQEQAQGSQEQCLDRGPSALVHGVDGVSAGLIGSNRPAAL